MINTHLEKIKENRINGIDLDQDMIYPFYSGLSNFNIPEGLCQFYDIPSLPIFPLDRELTTPFRKDYKNVVVILVDALSTLLLEKWMDADKSLIWNRLQKNGINTTLTSVVPSTTSTAISTIWTGTSPAMHGVLGYELWLKEYGIVANMIEHKPITYSGRSGNLSNAGFSPDNFLFGKSIATHFKEYGIRSHVFQHYSIINSGLSRSFMQDAELHAIGGVSDMWVSARELMESQQNDKKFVYVYWPAVDSLSHFHGPGNERVFAEFKLFSSAFEQLFIDKLSQETKKDTLVILTADHGQITTDKQIDDFDLKNHPAFLELLTIKPTGENRLPYLYIKPGRVEEVKQYINSKWADQFLLLDPKAAVENGFFGPGEPHKMIYERIGDLIVIPRGDSYWWWSNAKNPLTGQHGGLSRDEMLVPFLAFEVE